ncbi:MAG TPA: hypothetical protein VH458_24055 [Vicinamibacterales bacterium]|jgi:hypothetical protein
MKRKNIEDLRECQETVEKLEQQKADLEEENRHLRQAAGAFGQLAERLNVSLRQERRRALLDRRHEPRAAADRRQQ